jgi:ABC-type Mn2+/Zn2+ transport system permease subunit
VTAALDAVAYSLVSGVFVGFAAGYVGSLMVLKKMALVGDALSHVALPGLALGILFHFNPFIGAFAFLFAAAVATWYVEEKTKLSAESIVGVLFVLALAVGILLTPQPDLLEALFGDIAKVALLDAVLAVAISIPVVLLTRLIYRRVVLSLLSEELARSTGIHVARANLLYLFLVTLVVALGIKIVGTILVGALVIVPAAAMKSVSSNLARYGILSGITGSVSACAGILLATAAGLPAGPLVVIVGTGIFAAALAGHWLAARG